MPRLRWVVTCAIGLALLSLLFIGLEVAPDTVPEARRVVALIVGMRYDSQVDRRAIVEYATELLRAEAETLEANVE